ncbi:aldehyde dehydrogenase [Carex littledalei]|uniref:Aldehyde dehydrogenase n=1 Tax=Carex littledalei TaxID=544730 RepID=A0A833VCP7_9POAL|nr:aldehyde dehydrogenase [Carex littledalei]
MSAGAFANWIHSPFDRRKGVELPNFRYKIPFGSNEALWLRARHDYSLSKARVAADYSDSLPESTNHFIKHDYHPLEEYKEPKRKIDMFLSDVQLARTRDILFELPDEGLLQDVHITDFHVRVLIGMDSPCYNEKGTLIGGLNDNDIRDKLKLDSSDDEIEEACYYEYLHREEEITGFHMECGMPETLQQTHPLHFAKCLKKMLKLLHECGLPLEDADIINSDGVAMKKLLLETKPKMTLLKLEDAGFDWKILGKKDLIAPAVESIHL